VNNGYLEGLEPENIDYEGLPQVPLRSGFDWGEGGAQAGAATLLREFGGVYIDAGHSQAVGIDGVAVKSFSISDRTVRLALTNQLAQLPWPYRERFKVELCVVGLEPGNYELVVNGGEPRRVSSAELQRIPIEIGALS
jgi:hypothetical protein